MKIRIAYPMDTEEVPDKVIEFLGESHDELDNSYNNVKLAIGLLKTKDQKSFKHASYLLDNIRKKLTQIDDGIMNALSVLDGYIEVMDSIENGSIEEIEENPAPIEEQEPSGI